MTGLVEVAGFAILGGALAEASVNAYRSFRDGRVDLQRRQAELALFRERAHVELEATQIERQRRELAWEGLRKFYIRAEGPRRRTASVPSISSPMIAKRSAVPARPVFDLPVAHPRSGKAGHALLFAVRHAASSRLLSRYDQAPAAAAGRAGAPPGLASGFFHGLSEGDLVDVRAPAGHFYLDAPSDRPVVLIAGASASRPCCRCSTPSAARALGARLGCSTACATAAIT